MVKKKRKGGRPSKYETHVLPRMIEIEGWARDGLTDEQIARNIGVALSTFMTYKNKYPELSEALKRNKAVADREVENALFKRAVGYTYEEVTKELKHDTSTGECKLVVTKVVTKEVQPDVTAQIFWLKNRKPKEWRDKQEVEHSGDLGVVIVDDIPKG